MYPKIKIKNTYFSLHFFLFLWKGGEGGGDGSEEDFDNKIENKFIGYVYTNRYKHKYNNDSIGDYNCTIILSLYNVMIYKQKLISNNNS